MTTIHSKFGVVSQAKLITGTAEVKSSALLSSFTLLSFLILTFMIIWSFKKFIVRQEEMDIVWKGKKIGFYSDGETFSTGKIKYEFWKKVNNY